MNAALGQVCSLNSPFEVDVADYAAGRCPAIEVWLTKLETYLKSHSIDDAKRLHDEHGVRAPVASYQGGLLTSQGDARRAAWELFQRRLDTCRGLGIDTLVVACDVAPPMNQQDLDRAVMSLAQAARQAAERQVRVALEFQANAAMGNNLQTAAALVADAGTQNLGVCFDVFHFYTGPSKFEDLAYLTPDNLFHVQLCDLADTPRELATDSQRILPGDGEFSLQPVIDHLRAMPYDGYVSIELMNPQIWQVPPLQFGEIAMTALRKLLGEASMAI